MPTDVFIIEDLSQQRLPARSLAAVLQQAGHRARLVNFAGDDLESIVALAQRDRPRLIVFSILFAHRLAQNLALAARLRQAGLPAHLTLVGALPTFAYAALLDACPALDSTLRGIPEPGLAQLAEHLARGSDWRSTPGLAYRGATVQVNPLPPPALDLDRLPFPLRDDGIAVTDSGLGYATLESSRGCYHACSFCLPCALYRACGAPYITRNIPALVEEIESLYRRGARLFLFDDEQFLPPGRARLARSEQLGDQLAQRNLEIAFTIKCRADDVDEFLFGRLKAMGLIRVYLGVESGCQASLDLFNKGVTAARNAQALAALNRLGIVADFRSLMFHPLSTLETLQAEIAFLEHALPDVPTVFTFREVECYVGTPLGQYSPHPLRPLDYVIADPRAELVRRISRIVFGARDAPHGLHAQTSRAWYNILLARRFGASRSDQAAQLKETITRLNRETLSIWRELLAFAASDQLYNVELVNQRAAEWAQRARAADAAAQDL